MIICGLKLTHDGAIALIEDGRLLFSVEVEKLGNGRRYGQVEDLAVVEEVLAGFGYRVEDVDEWAIDGWDGVESGHVDLLDHGSPLRLALAPYRESDAVPDVLVPAYRGHFPVGGGRRPYASYVHIAGHIASAYCTSPFAGQPSLVLVWDGGLFPRLYSIDSTGQVENGGELFPLIGHSYATAAHHFGPFRRADESRTMDDLSVAGKLMAYIALGTPRPEVVALLREVFARRFETPGPEVAEYRSRILGVGSNAEPSHQYVHAFFREIRERVQASDEDVLASVHQFLEELLVERLAAAVLRWKGEGRYNLCFVGGCALNIKWNSALRAMPMFRDVYVPPFPNDSGSAVGVAAAHLAHIDKLTALEWHPRSGPDLVATPQQPPDWTSSPCTPEQLAGVLHETGRPVVVLNGRAEVGPRALGGRSILAPAHDPAMKDLLNEVKGREYYRPVAPICLVECAPEIFDPGTPDPHMLFDHEVRPEWRDRIPAVMHLDGTARLQTVSVADDPTLEAILREYRRLSGVPVLCNTSANYNGRGFFPDLASAFAWGRVDRVWSDGVLYIHG